MYAKDYLSIKVDLWYYNKTERKINTDIEPSFDNLDISFCLSRQDLVFFPRHLVVLLNNSLFYYLLIQLSNIFLQNISLRIRDNT